MIAYVATAVMAVATLTATAESPQWESSYGKALEATRTDNQPLLVVLDKPQAVDARVAPELLSPAATEGREAELLRPYRLCHVDVTTEYGQRVADAFKAKTFPYVAVIDKTGSVILYSKEGKVATDEWSRVLTAFRSGERSTAVSRVSYKPAGSAMFQSPSQSYSIGGSYCPSCQRRPF
jgi:hypothetical protein